MSDYKTFESETPDIGSNYGEHPKPWAEQIDPSELLDNIVKVIKKHIVCSKETVDTTALWIAMTWFIDEIRIAPLAIITAPEKRCGKSQLLTLMSKLVKNPLVASNITHAALFRTIDSYKPTLLIDEADTFLRANEETRGILNCGHNRDSAYVIRSVGKDHTPKKFFVWGAKAIAGIGKLSDTLMDRGIILELCRKFADEKIYRMRDSESDFVILTSKLARFAADYKDVIKNATPYSSEELNDREQDNWESLFAIADTAGERWAATARQAALKLTCSITKEQSLSIELLNDIYQILNRKDKIKSEHLISELCIDKEKPWATYNRGNDITPRQVAIFLKEFQIRSATIRFMDGTAKGYMKDWFTDAFNRYVPKPEVTAAQANDDNGYMDVTMLPVTNARITDVSNENKECDVVTEFFAGTE